MAPWLHLYPHRSAGRPLDTIQLTRVAFRSHGISLDQPEPSRQRSAVDGDSTRRHSQASVVERSHQSVPRRLGAGAPLGARALALADQPTAGLRAAAGLRSAAGVRSAAERSVRNRPTVRSRATVRSKGSAHSRASSVSSRARSPGLSHSPFQQLGSNRATGRSRWCSATSSRPFGQQNPILAQLAQGGLQQGPWGIGQIPFTGIGGLSHTGNDIESLYARPLWSDPMLQARVRETFPYLASMLPPVVSLF